ncbi:MAG: molybdopterin-synthase adenylyltransferase MoeB [Rhodospirillaceae bacterium]|nr:molybdopterin-synthase adenylyltransferase MoeB [Rhodospirillaceae bacterium]
MDLSEAQFHRYARHLIMDEVGDEGQEKLLTSRVLVIGAGGLGSPVLLYLAAAGVGTLGIIDDDTVDITNLQRQIVHETAALERAKVDSAAETIARINPETNVERHNERLTVNNVESLFQSYDLIVDGSDNFATRYLANDAAYFAGKPLVSGSLLRFEGQISTFRGGVKTHDDRGHGDEPCYRCIFAEAPPPGMVPRCEEAGILGAVAGVIGTLQATEVLKELMGLGDSLSGTLLMYDALSTSFRKIKVKRNAKCALCGDEPTIQDLSIHAS